MKNKLYKTSIYFLLLLALFLFFTSRWLTNQFGELDFEMIIFTVFANSQGANLDIFYQYLKELTEVLLYYTVIFLLAEFALRKLYARYSSETSAAKRRIYERIAVFTVSVFVVIISVHLSFNRLGVYSYIEVYHSQSDIYDAYYIDPRDVEISFPEEKRNLIYIVLESMETSYAAYTLPSGETVNLIPNLMNLAEENLYFSDTEGFGGAKMAPNTSWTSASLVAQTAGISLNLPSNYDPNDYGTEGVFLPGVVSLGEILSEEGYDNYFMIGSDGSFGGRSAYFQAHGNYEILDHGDAIQKGLLDENYFVYWGYEDQLLFEFSKEYLLNIAQNDTPFNFTLLTVDTHFMDGYTDAGCETNYEVAYANAIACSDKKVVDFVRWIQEQDFYDDTTIIISGDHFTMNAQFLEDSDTEFRSLYNAVINSPLDTETIETKGREFTVLDWFPTTLELLNVDVEGHRLGLGSSLISNAPTLSELKGWDYFSTIRYKSSFYNRSFLGLPN